MSKTPNLLFFVSMMTVLLLSSFSFATTSVLHEEAVAQTVQNLCVQNDQILFVGHFYMQSRDAISKELSKIMHYKDFEMHTIWKESGGLSPELFYMLNSFTFMKEMARCFPSESQRNRLVMKIILADLAGQLTATTQVIATVVGPGKVAGFIVKKLYPVYLNVMARFPSIAPMSQRALSWSMEAITTLATMGYFVSEKFSFFSPKPEDVIRVQSRIVLLEKRMAQLERLIANRDVTLDRYCVYQDVLYKTAQEFLELSRKIKAGADDISWKNRLKHAREIESCTPTDNSNFIVPIL